MDETIYKRSRTGKKISHDSATQHFRLRFENRTLDINKSILIGRDKSNDVVLSNDPLVSRRHAIIEVTDGTYRLRDLGSTNHTYLNNSPLPPNKSVLISIGDVITIGHTQLHLSRV